MRTNIHHNLTNKQLLNTCVKYGLIGAVLYAAWFLLMRLAGLAQVTELRFLNYILMCLVSFFALKQSTDLNGRQPRFFTKMGIIFLTCACSFVAFGIFIFFYSLVDPFIIHTFNNLYPGSMAFGKFSAPVFIASEGIGLASVAALGMTFFFRLSKEKNKDTVIPA